MRARSACWTLVLYAGSGNKRQSHLKNHSFPDATFDFIFTKGLTASQATGNTQLPFALFPL